MPCSRAFPIKSTSQKAKVISKPEMVEKLPKLEVVEELNTEVIFREALAHCRWKEILRQNIKEKIKLDQFNSNMSFDEIHTKIHSLISPVNGLGPLTIYDLTSGLCAHFKIPISKIYIVGKGPKRAVKLLGLQTKNEKIGKSTLNYLEIDTVISTFQEKGLKLEDHLESSRNGDEFESFLCNWQKGK